MIELNESRSDYPPLPDPIPTPEPIKPDPEILRELEKLPLLERKRMLELFPWRLRTLREGCYLIRYTPLIQRFLYPLFHYDGTMRVQKESFNTIASGDLYIHRWWWLVPKPVTPTVTATPIVTTVPTTIVRADTDVTTMLPYLFEPNPSQGIPIFPIARYRYYLRVTQILEWLTITNSFTLGFEMHRFDQSNNTFTKTGDYTAKMQWTTAPPGYPSGSDYLVGQVKNRFGTVVGTLTMGWVSPYLRRATIEIDRVSASEEPLNNGAGENWQTIHNRAGWDVNVIVSDTNVTEPSGESWDTAELHNAMLAWRDSANLDIEWRYHLLCVRRLDMTSRGIMYDAYGGDSNNIPRESAAIASHWVIPNQDPPWGHVAGMRFGTATAPYFRTAVHEIGHAQGLYHNTADNGIMNVTPVIASNAVSPEKFPDNIQWSFKPEDEKRLRHMPDIWVRPGGTPFGLDYSIAPISPDDMVMDAEELELIVSPLLEAVPIGAPVRVNFSLINNSKKPYPVPASLSMRTGYVKGRVIDPSGKMRTFSPLFRCIEEQQIRMLEPGESMSYSVTLLRGAQGALFPTLGLHTVVVEVRWEMNGVPLRVEGMTNVIITPPVDESHAKAAHKILSTPDALLTLAIGGDHLKDGIEAIRAGLDDPTLRPHYAFIEAKRVGKRFGKRKPNLDISAKLLDKTTIMSKAEAKRARELIKDVKKPTVAIKQMSKLLDKIEKTLK